MLAGLSIALPFVASVMSAVIPRRRAPLGLTAATLILCVQPLNLLWADDLGAPLSYSSEAEEPFLYLGTSPYVNVYLAHLIKHVERFPTALSCLTPEARTSDTPDLADFSWRSMKYREDVQVCLFRIASSYSTMDQMEEWMRSQGMRIGRRTFSFVRKDEVSIQGYWDPGELGAPYGSGLLFDTWISLISNGISMSVRYADNGSVHSTYVIVNTK